MKILLLGSGGREHAFAHFISRHPAAEKLYIAPGNAGTSLCGINLVLNPLDFEAVYEFAKAEGIDLILPGGEDTLVAGISDFIHQKNVEYRSEILVAGPSKQASQLEGSKDFSKAFMNRHHIPTAASLTVMQQNLEDGIQFLQRLTPPYVLKADGLAAGKGVIITSNLDEATATLKEMILDAKFGEASSKVVLEEFLHGIEISVFAVSDGDNWKVLASAKDYKRIGEGDTGLNTGGMGAISPVPFADAVFLQKVEERILQPTFDGMRKEGMPFKGFLFVGLMNCNGDPKVIEYNVRMGDPETEAIFPRLKTPVLDIVTAIAGGGVKDLEIELTDSTATTIFLVSGGYPEAFEKGKPMQIPDAAQNTWLFHAGTKNAGDAVVTNGGRVLAVTGLGSDLLAAKKNAVMLAEKTIFDGKYYRTDIGVDLMQLK